MNCQFGWTVSLDELSVWMNCQIGWTVSLDELSVWMNCQFEWTVKNFNILTFCCWKYPFYPSDTHLYEKYGRFSIKLQIRSNKKINVQQHKGKGKIAQQVCWFTISPFQIYCNWIVVLKLLYTSSFVHIYLTQLTSASHTASFIKYLFFL